MGARLSFIRASCFSTHSDGSNQLQIRDMGRGNIFSGDFCAGQGLGSVPIDQIADELNMLGIVTGSTDDLLELLKTKERSRRGYYQKDVTEDLNEKNRLGVPVSRVTVVESEVLAQELDEAQVALAGQDLPNVIEGITAQVIAKQKRKLESATAANKSMDNGFTRGRGLPHR